MSTRKKKRTPATPPPASPPRRWVLPGVAILGVVVALVLFLYVRGNEQQSAPAEDHAASTPAPAATGPLNIVLVTLDTLRADRLGCYGDADAETPNMDAIAAAGTRYDDAVTVVPTTLAAHASILTGLTPPVHGVRTNGHYRLAQDQESLAEVLQGAGYSTGAFVSAFVLDGRFGLDQGFDTYDHRLGSASPGLAKDVNPERRGDATTDEALAWLEDHHRDEGGFFLWLHLYDPHSPYLPPPPFSERHAQDPYDGEVAFTDHQVGRLVDRMRSLGLLERTLLVLAGDHGEGLGEHGESTHGMLIYESTLRVPLILHAPGIVPAASVVDDRVVSILDVRPTILEVLGIAGSPGEGSSLLGGESDADRAIYVETLDPSENHGWSPLFGLRQHGSKYIDAPTPEYYDLGADPGELRNLAASAPQATELADRLSSVRSAHPDGDDRSLQQLDPASVQALEALGYVVADRARQGASLANPVEVLARTEERHGQATTLVASGRFEEAIPLIEELLETSPHDPSLWSLLRESHMATDNLEEALVAGERALELQPRDSVSWVKQGNLRMVAGDLEGWEHCLAEAERIEPDLGGIHISRAMQALYAGRLDEALAHCERAEAADPSRYRGSAQALKAQILSRAQLAPPQR